MRIRVGWRVSIGLVATVLKYLSIPLAFPLALAIYYGEPMHPFVLAIIISVGLGLGCDAIARDGDLYAREAFLAISLIWFVVAVIGAIPFITAGHGVTASPINALFESMSGITTTGATVILNFDAHSRSILMWRQVIQWLGGLGVLILATAVLAEVGVGGAQLMESETWTPTVTRLTPRIEQTARLLFRMYVVITVGVILSLYGLYITGLAPNMTLYNAIAHAFTSISTAGFSPEPESAGAFSPVAQWVLTGAMVCGGTSFPLIYLGITDDVRRVLTSEELRLYFGTIVGASGIVLFALIADPSIGFGTEGMVRHALFNTVSILTTTGFASTDFDVWAPAAKSILFVCMFLGAMVGSTTCSIKTLRWLVVGKALRRSLFTAVHKAAIRPIRVGGDVVDEETVRDVYGFVLMSLFLVFGLAIFIVVDAARVGLDVSEFEAMAGAASTFLNIGPAFGLAGPYESYHAFPRPTKIAMILLMWIGRVEILPVLVLFTAAFWRS